MPLSRPLLAGAVLLAVSGLALTACSGGSSSPGTTTTTAAAPTATTTTSAADVALARSELVPASGFPAGWQGQGASSEDTQASVFGGIDSADLDTITSCMGISKSEVDPTPAEAAEQEYDDPNSSLTVADTVDVFPSVAAAAFDTSAGGNPKLPACFTQFESTEVSKKVPKNITIGKMSAKTGSVPAYGDQDAAFEVSFPFTYQGVSGTLYMEFVVVRKGRSESNLQFTNTGGYPPASVVDPLSAKAANALTG